MPGVAIVKIERNDNSIFMLLDSDGDICPIVDLFDTSYFSYKAKIPTPLLVYADVGKVHFSPSYMKLLRHKSRFQHSLFLPSSSSSCLNIIDAFKLTKSRERSKSDLTTY